MTRFYRCNKCGHQFMAGDGVGQGTFKCGAVTEYIVADDPDVGNDDIVRSAGIKPLGCGGEIKEITQEEAMNHVSKK